MKTSKLWESLTKTQFSKIDETFLATFREPGNANNRLAAWDPFDRSMRYFKFLFFHQLQTKDATFFSNYRKIGLTSLGNPVTLTSFSGEEVNLDHFFAVEEFTFLHRNLDFSDVHHVVEIGAGFGRTAQALIKLVEHIGKYTIIDIPEVLALSSSYLKKVLSAAEFEKLYFVNAYNLSDNGYNLSSIDLVINIDSFQEMTVETIRYYFEIIINTSRFFYSKNAVGKYRPETVGLFNIDEKQLLDVFSLGLSTDIIDIFNERELDVARQKHVELYCPSTQFSVITLEPLGIFPYYLNVLYEKNA